MTVPTLTRRRADAAADPYRWTEADGKLAVWQRTGADPQADIPGRCEGCGQLRGLDPSHRIPSSQGGTWSPVNLLGLCRECHDWLHGKQYLAHGLGWELDRGPDLRVRPDDVSAASPAWILTPNSYRPEWHLLGVELDTEGVRRHVVRPAAAVWSA